MEILLLESFFLSDFIKLLFTSRFLVIKIGVDFEVEREFNNFRKGL